MGDQGEGRRDGREGGGVYSIFRHGRSRMTIAIRPSHTHNGGTEHVGFLRRDGGG